MIPSCLISFYLFNHLTATCEGAADPGQYRSSFSNCPKKGFTAQNGNVSYLPYLILALP